MVCYVTTVIFRMTSLMNEWTNIIMNDGWMSSSIGQNPTFSCWLLFSWFRLHPKDSLSALKFSQCDDFSFAYLKFQLNLMQVGGCSTWVSGLGFGFTSCNSWSRLWQIRVWGWVYLVTFLLRLYVDLCKVWYLLHPKKYVMKYCHGWLKFGWKIT